MAWQLIYTSAPRSLEAGRSGFGTVARHRDISPLLVSAIERTSQFSRLAGVDAGRVIFSHRIVAIAGGRFHVLSSIRDAGADYTGRTNHIAHHLIADSREIAQLGANGPSPADVLLAMNWATSWTEQPRFLEVAEEIRLATIQPQTNGSAWQQIAGSPEQAWLLASGDASRGAYVIQPVSADLRAVFAESLRLIPERLWQISFTTSLQPSDEPADFRWIGIEERSPLRAQTESSGRPILNLAAPNTLPLVEVVQSTAAATSNPFAPSRVANALPTRVAVDSPPAGEHPSVLIDRLSRPPREQTAPSVRRKTTDKFAWKWVVGAGVAVLLAAILLLVVVPIFRSRWAEHLEREQIVKIIDETVKFTKPGPNSEKPQELRNVSLADLRTLQRLADLTREMIVAMKAVDSEDFRKLNAAEEAYSKVRREASKSSLHVPPQFDEIQNRITNSIQLHEIFGSFQPSSENYPGFMELQRAAEKVKAMDASSDPHAGKLQDELRAEAAKEEASALLAFLNGSMDPKPPVRQPDGQIKWFEGAVQEGENRAPSNKEQFRKVRELLEDWQFVEHHALDKEPINLEERLAQRLAWPSWLKAKAQGIIGATRSGKGEEVERSALGTASGGLHRSMSSGKPVASSRPALYFVDSKEKLSSIEIKELVPELAFELKKQSGEIIKLVYKFDAIRETPTSAKLFNIENHKLVPDLGAEKLLAVPGSAKPPPPFVFIGRDANDEKREVLLVYVGRAPGSEPLFPNAEIQLERKETMLIIRGEIPQIAPILEPKYLLLTPSGFDGSGTAKQLPVTGSGQCDLQASLTDANNRISEKRAFADSRTKQASEQSAAGGSIDDLRKKSTEYSKILKKETAKKLFDEKAPTGPELVGDFAKALAEELTDGKDKSFEDLRTKGVALGEAFANPVEAQARNKDILVEVQKLEQKQHAPQKVDGLSKLRSLCNKLAASFGGTVAIDREITQLHQAAATAAGEAKALEQLPLLTSKTPPPGEYSLIAKLKGMNDVKLFTFTVK